MLYLVRHAKAGDRAAWKGDDRLRPLSKEGRRQADSLARLLARLTTGELVSICQRPSSRRVAPQ